MVCGQGSRGTAGRESDWHGKETRPSCNNTEWGALGAWFPARETETDKNGLARERHLWPSGGGRLVNREL